jgi:DNA polymerase-4/DNA polymerase V
MSNTSYRILLFLSSGSTHRLPKPQREIWLELHGECVYGLEADEKHDYASISKTKTFTPSSRDKDYVFAQLSKNIENAYIKVRRHSLAACVAVIYLKTQDFHSEGIECLLSATTAVPSDVIRGIRPAFEKLFSESKDYRATGVISPNLLRTGIVNRTCSVRPFVLRKCESCTT